MNSLAQPRYERMKIKQQRGLVLFFALIALVIMSLAAVALIRSVDTNTMIAGNLSFKQATTNSGDLGVENAITWLFATQLANTGKNVYMDGTHSFNITDTTRGYYSNADPAVNVFTDTPWDNITAIPAVTDSSGNTSQYIIQRMCRTANTLIRTDDCLFSGAIVDKFNQTVPLAQDICFGAGCPVAGQTPQIRITTRTTGPKNTVSYIQAFVY